MNVPLRKLPRRGLRRLLLAPLGALAVVGLTGMEPGSSSDEPSAEERAEPHVVRSLLRPLNVGPFPCDSAILVEAETGAVLYEQNADKSRPPASLVKMMLQVIVFQEIEAGRLSWTDEVHTSANASTMGGSQVYLKHGERQEVLALMQAVVISSANDAAMALAEHIAGNEEAFVARMNEEASRIGCTGTKFANVHGLDLRWQDQNLTTARDIALIAQELIRHPRALELSSTWRAPLRGGEFWLDNTNKLLKRYDGLDGLKTGYTSRAGGCFCGTALRDGVRLISVVMRSHPGRARFDVSARLLDAGYAADPVWVDVVVPDEDLTPLGPVPVDGVEEGVPARAGGHVRVLLERGRESELERRIRPLAELSAPFPAGETVGYLDCRLEGRTFASVPARAASGLQKGFWGGVTATRGAPRTVAPGAESR